MLRDVMVDVMCEIRLRAWITHVNIYGLINRGRCEAVSITLARFIDRKTKTVVTQSQVTKRFGSMTNIVLYVAVTNPCTALRTVQLLVSSVSRDLWKKRSYQKEKEVTRLATSTTM